MSYKYIKILLLCSALAGCSSVSLDPIFNDCNAAHALCAPVPANTTASISSITPATQPQPVSPPIPEAVTSSVAAPAVAVLVPESTHPIRIALLLPLRSETLGRAAAAVRAGFLAAHAHDQDGVTVDVIGTDVQAAETLSIYNNAQANHDVIVGPLSRSSVSAVARSGMVRIPTIALNQPLPVAPLPPAMLAMGLSIEDEARQVALWASREHAGASAFVVAANIGWQRRVATAFATEWQHLGLPVQSVELAVSEGYLSANGLEQLRTRLQNEQPALLLVAMDAVLTRQLRQAIGTGIPVYGTSQLNASTDNVAADDDGRVADPLLEGVHLVDMPWQLQPDHPAVMAYPRLITSADRKDNPDLERLYALGIDAYRIAHEIGLGHKQFEIDGVTGYLSVTFDQDQADGNRIDRVASQAVYQDGAMLLLPGTR